MQIFNCFSVSRGVVLSMAFWINLTTTASLGVTPRGLCKADDLQCSVNRLFPPAAAAAVAKWPYACA